jgi:hypothetical protein
MSTRAQVEKGTHTRNSRLKVSYSVLCGYVVLDISLGENIDFFNLFTNQVGVYLHPKIIIRMGFEYIKFNFFDRCVGSRYP